jgi:hypothetical protein
MLRGNDIEWSNPYGNRTTHFIACTKSLNDKNSCYNHKKIGTTSGMGPIICVSSINERKTQIGWVVAIGQIM